MPGSMPDSCIFYCNGAWHVWWRIDYDVIALIGELNRIGYKVS